MLKVLVVDDEAPIRRWLEYCIDQFDGFTVAGVAASGTEGLEIYRRERPNIVVSDIEMPGMDGLEMLRRMQKIHPAYMIILTSHEKFSYARQALNLGTAEYILKAEITMQSFQTVLLKAADTIRGRGVSDTGDAEQAARRFLKQLLADGWPGEEADIGGMLQRYGIRLRQKTFFAADILSRDGTELRALRRLAQDAPGLENLSMFPLDYDHLLIIANLGQEGGYPSVVQYFESKNHLSFIVDSAIRPGNFQNSRRRFERQRPDVIFIFITRTAASSGKRLWVCWPPDIRRSGRRHSAKRFSGRITGRLRSLRIRRSRNCSTTARQTWMR